MAGIEREGQPGHKYQYNDGTEREQTFGLNWDETDFRVYDPQLGRFHQVDMLAEFDFDWTPYRFGYNNPISYNDPLGLWERTATGWRTSDQSEIRDFIDASKRAGKGIEIMDAAPGNETGELFRVMGEGSGGGGFVGIFHGEERAETGWFPMVGIHSQKHHSEVQSIMEGVPLLGGGYTSMRQMGEGDYLSGALSTVNFLTQRSIFTVKPSLASKSLFGNKNGKDAISDFVIYLIRVNGVLWKVGKADAGRKRANGVIERIAQQIQILRDHLPSSPNVVREILWQKRTTTADALEVEKAFVRQLKSPQRTTNRNKIKSGYY